MQIGIKKLYGKENTGLAGAYSFCVFAAFHTLYAAVSMIIIDYYVKYKKFIGL